jgi:hypothetical protein
VRGAAAAGGAKPGHGSEYEHHAEFQQIVLAHLLKRGVQNTVRSQRLEFDSLEPWPGAYVHAVGEYGEKGRRKPGRHLNRTRNSQR